MIDLLELARFIPQCQFDAIPEAELVVDQAQIVLYYMLGGAERIGDFAVLAALGYALNDEVFPFVGAAEAPLLFLP